MIRHVILEHVCLASTMLYEFVAIKQLAMRLSKSFITLKAREILCQFTSLHVYFVKHQH